VRHAPVKVCGLLRLTCAPCSGFCNAAHFIQSKDRIHRYGLKPEDHTNYYYILSDNNIDRTIHERLSFKEKRMMQIIENEPIPLFNRLKNDDSDDIKVLINNYVANSRNS
jgi:hypothetical protein